MMKVLAPFDQTYVSQATIPLLIRLAGITGIEVAMLSVARPPEGTLQEPVRRSVVTAAYVEHLIPALLPDVELRQAETKEQAIDRVLSELENYLRSLAKKLPEGVEVRIEAHLANDPVEAIVNCAREEEADVIVMATRSRSRLSKLIFGSTTQKVIQSGVAPVLVVSPREDVPYEREPRDERSATTGKLPSMHPSRP
jgi:nucleotide-binding universal stress UspA family protein